MRGATAIAGASLLLAASVASAQTVSPQEVFRRAAPSVVVVEIKEYPKSGPSRVIASGSGVVIPSRDKDKTTIVTNCHVVDKSPRGMVGITQGEAKGLGQVVGRDDERDLCVVQAVIFAVSGQFLRTDEGKPAFKKLPAVEVGSSQWLEVGDQVYAVGAPQGLELSLSNGLVSGFREYKGNEYIQTTAPISKGSSGGGLFDAQGRLVGITTMYVEDGQALNFAVPAELIASVRQIDRKQKADGNTHMTRSDAAQAAAAAAAENPRTPSRITTSSRWRAIHHDEAHYSTTYIDTRSLSISGDAISTWIRTTGFGVWVEDGQDIRYHEEFMRVTFYCDSWRILIEQSYITDLKGSVLKSRGKNGPFTVSPSSLHDPIIGAVCSP